ncbi:MAG: 23S rRNA (uracil(1939)-C(5))-methyltransferase RlmD [Peptoniphilus sp.]|nr:23S rRNA (uracil(1939)-C(5))-methyltransferase RlmD [Peptoniphilus sp.]
MKLQIKDFDYKGRGVAKKDERIYFVEGGVIGDTVEAELTYQKKKFTLAQTQRVLNKSRHRITPKCPYFGKCGGCDFLNYKYSEQLKWKASKVNQDYKRIGGLDLQVEEIYGMEKPYHYRNNIQLKIKEGKLGYFAKNSRDLVPIKHCPIAEDEINKALGILSSWKGLPSCDEVILRQNYKNQLSVVLVTKDRAKYTNNLLKELLELNLHSLFENINNGKLRFGKKFNKIYGEDHLVDKLLDFEFKLSPSSFFQVNRTQAEKLYKLALDSLDIGEEDRILDLYCGVGTIALNAAPKAREVYGVEISEEAIENARENAAALKITNTYFAAGKSEEVIEKLIKEEKFIPNKIILDPPRAGLDTSLIETLKELKAEKISYISCNPSTQARDLKLLSSAYKIEKAYAVDMFCHSAHTEALTLLSRNL